MYFQKISKFSHDLESFKSIEIVNIDVEYLSEVKNLKNSYLTKYKKSGMI